MNRNIVVTNDTEVIYYDESTLTLKAARRLGIYRVGGRGSPWLLNGQELPSHGWILHRTDTAGTDAYSVYLRPAMLKRVEQTS